jgi:hypothetical protein
MKQPISLGEKRAGESSIISGRKSVRSSATHIGGSVMLRYRTAFDEADEAMLDARKQDDEFCRLMRAAIERGQESCPIGVSREPGTKKPIINYQRPDSYH